MLFFRYIPLLFHNIGADVNSAKFHLFFCVRPKSKWFFWIFPYWILCGDRMLNVLFSRGIWFLIFAAFSIYFDFSFRMYGGKCRLLKLRKRNHYIFISFDIFYDWNRCFLLPNAHKIQNNGKTNVLNNWIYIHVWVFELVSTRYQWRRWCKFFLVFYPLFTLLLQFFKLFLLLSIFIRITLKSNFFHLFPFSIFSNKRHSDWKNKRYLVVKTKLVHANSNAHNHHHYRVKREKSGENEKWFITTKIIIIIKPWTLSAFSFLPFKWSLYVYS